MAETTAPRRNNRRGEGGRLREEILAAASDLIERTGTEQSVTLRAVAREIGIAAPSIYEHFAGRDAIVDAVIASAADDLRVRVEHAVASESEPLARLRAGCIAYLDFAEEQPSRYLLIFTRREPSDVSLATAARNEVFEVLVAALRATAGEGASADLLADAITIRIALHGYATLRPTLPDFPWPTHAEQVDRILTRFG
ncbi:TetR/AcrR family transcriptional regulator [Agromyces protaetiae]|uniref:TetR/AcrR family transcriptional regulator n=1 Tax=Agromyces protaetiae TaxID=2509455 RepID=A0A4P6FPY1_9MICO|nr:TetR/AcrR family transcriptional regulator [Agromyces protaetiae]QAY72578.1 TetR/AcrR family transcriptional regulator [Agromyces protaetiae]